MDEGTVPCRLPLHDWYSRHNKLGFQVESPVIVSLAIAILAVTDASAASPVTPRAVMLWFMVWEIVLVMKLNLESPHGYPDSTPSLNLGRRFRAQSDVSTCHAKPQCQSGLYFISEWLIAQNSCSPTRRLLLVLVCSTWERAVTEGVKYLWSLSVSAMILWRNMGCAVYVHDSRPRWWARYVKN